MSTHTGLSHDLDGPIPHAPLPDDWKRVHCFKIGSFWTWEHYCAWKNHATDGYPEDSQPVAFARALKHMEGCW